MKGIYLSVLPDILETNANSVLPTALSIKIAKFNNEVTENSKIYKEVLNRLVENYVEKDEDGNLKIDSQGNAKLKENYRAEWDKEYRELENQEFEFKTKFTLDELEKLELTPIQASAMLTLVDE